MNLKLIEIILRVGVFGTFLGHGLIALKSIPDWIPYLTTIGFSTEQAINIMPVIGVIDILVAFITLIKPLKPVLIYAFVWAFLTALIRPIAGDSFLMFVERAANWVVPLALYFYLFNPIKKP